MKQSLDFERIHSFTAPQLLHSWATSSLHHPNAPHDELARRGGRIDLSGTAGSPQECSVPDRWCAVFPSLVVAKPVILLSFSRNVRLPHLQHSFVSLPLFYEGWQGIIRWSFHQIAKALYACTFILPTLILQPEFCTCMATGDNPRPRVGLPFWFCGERVATFGFVWGARVCTVGL